MIRCKTQKQRIDDICERSGLSEEIVKRVLEEDSKSVEESLVRGERVVLYGKCSMTPVLVNKLGLGGVINTFVDVKCKVSPTLVNNLNKVDGYKIARDKSRDNLLVKTISFQS